MTQIEWTHLPGFKGESWNPILGCSIVSKGCTNCYAMKFAAARLDGNPNAPQYFGTTKRVNGKGVWTGRVSMARGKTLAAPLRARKPRCYFVNSMGDLFAENVPDEWIDQVFAVMALAPQHRFIVLTKRPARMRDYLVELSEGGRRARLVSVQAESMARRQLPRRYAPAVNDEVYAAVCTGPLPNVWLGVSVEDQVSAD